ncbi:glycoside hydrolase family 125 protein [Microbacterium immunditiarum]|uniref:Glycoside hydrolase family 125 protein n=1 Tax=Microbacterium immunditiarum TaxID=337480 RepID=A0A7Y9GM94_9MICO|nr:hypothetical protein [Microbacterium immunditiarum]
MDLYSPAVAERLFAQIGERLGDEVAAVFRRCYLDTLDRTIRMLPDGSVFVVTGDIPAMWLRDSTAQLTPYLHFIADDPQLAETALAVSRRQLEFIRLDPYANAFNATASGAGHHTDQTEMSSWVWERKYEIDSLAYPIQLAHDLWKLTGRTDHLTSFLDAARLVVDLWATEQHHEQRSPYRFQRFDGAPTDTLAREGLGGPVAVTGLTWSGFRPSDDVCAFHNNVPANMFAFVELGHIAEIATAVFDDDGLAGSARALRDEIGRAIAAHGTATSPSGDTIYAYEVDGLGGVLLADDANTPSLLSLPLLGWCAVDDPAYLHTRRFVLSPDNPFYFTGTAAAGVGSPHTPPGMIWPIALAVQGLTARDDEESRDILAVLMRTHAGTGFMHESFHKDDPDAFTREWFSWANAMFCELVLEVAGLRTHRRIPAEAVTR